MIYLILNPKYNIVMVSAKTIITIFAVLLIVPVGISFAQLVNEDNSEKSNLDVINDDNGTVGPVGTVNELYKGHSTITNIMIDHSEGNYAIADELVFTATFVDEETEELVVMLDPILPSLGIYPDAGDIEDVLGTEELSIRIEFGVFIPESHADDLPTQIDTAISLYELRCILPTTNGLCSALTDNLEMLGYTLDSNNMWQAPSLTLP